jgi:hypothetical protein
MDLVKLKRQLAKSDLEKRLIDILQEKVKSLPSYEELRLNPELILLCCNLIENGCKKKDKVDKKLLCINILDSVFNYSTQEKRQVDDSIEFLWATKRIKRISLVKKNIYYIAEILKRRFL